MKETFVASMDKWRTMGHSLIQTDLFITCFRYIFNYYYGSNNKRSHCQQREYSLGTKLAQGLTVYLYAGGTTCISQNIYKNVKLSVISYEFNAFWIRNSVKKHRKI